MKIVNVYEAKAHFSQLLEAVQNGEEVIIAKAGRPVADLKPHIPKRQRIQFGLLKGQIHYHAEIVGPDPDIIKDFEDSRIFPDGSI
jgi:prevent-host-death family protein